MQLLTEAEYGALSPGQRSAYLQEFRDYKAMGGEGEIPSMSPVGSVNKTSVPPEIVNTGIDVISGIAGIGNQYGQTSAFKGGLNAATRGASLEDVAKATGTAGVMGVVGQQLNKFAGPFAGLGVNTAMEATKKNPNFELSTVQSIPSLVGGVTSLVNPIVGIAAGTLASYFVNDALPEGWAGDWANVRHNEIDRDELEDMGYSRDETASIMANELDSVNNYSYGYDNVSELDDEGDKRTVATGMRHSNTFTNANVSNYDPAADNPVSSLRDYYDSVSGNSADANGPGSHDSTGRGGFGDSGENDPDGDDRGGNSGYGI